MNKSFFAFDPKDYGLPDYETFREFRIWDTHYHGFLSKDDPFGRNDKMLDYVHRFGIERVISMDIGGRRPNILDKTPFDVQKRKYLEDNSDFFSGLVRIDPGYPEESVEKMVDWIENGPCIGIKYEGGNRLGVTCDHPNNDVIIQKAIELNAIVYIHTWIKTSGDPRVLGSGNNPGESTPMNVINLAKRFPEKQFICGHAGGDWEIGVRTIRPFDNVFLEFSGSDPQSGGVDMAVNELGVDRIVWGGHGPTRSYSTEMSKVLDADLTIEGRKKVFGRNYRQMAKPIFDDKGIFIEI